MNKPIESILGLTYVHQPEMVSELHSSNRILNMDSRIKEIIDYSKAELSEIKDPEFCEILRIIIKKLDKI